MLESAPAWSIDGQQLILTSPKGETLTLTSKHTAPLTLPGSSWRLEQLVTPGSHQTGFAGPSLAFDNHGSFRATDGSGDTLTGTATNDGSHVTFARNPSTYRGPRKHEPSRAIDTMLSGQLGFQIGHNTLRLYELKSGAGQLFYKPAA